MSETDPLAFLDSNEPEAQAEVTTQEAPVQEQQAAAVEPEPVPEPIKEEPIVEPRVPLAALHEERFKRQEEERKRQEAEQENAYLRQFVQPQEDEYVDPVVQLQAQMYSMRLEMSKELAKQTHGAELVEKAHEWAFNKCNVDPYFNQRMSQSLNPYAEAVAEYKRDQIASQVTPETFAAFQAWQQQQMQTQQPAAAVPSAVSQQPAMTSLKSIAQAGGVKPPRQAAPINEQDVFNAMFP
ncbi:MAG: hypothetical protein ING71_16700 [Rhodocyclaceae bacterium]|nr:hypothetical protein [Rhodocyclaceae bacterium]